MSKVAKVYLKFDRYGLCNKIIMWAKAYVFAKNNNAILITSSWFHIPFGNLIRREKTLRVYWSFFNNKKSPFLFNFILKKLPRFSSIDKQNVRFTKAVFEGIPYVSDLPLLAPYRNEIINSFYNMITKENKLKIENNEFPVIGVHIRRGDFNVNGSATCNEYYINLIEKIRALSDKNLPVTIFSDGFDNELEEILNLKHTKRFKTQNDLVDLVVMSRSEILVTSKGSSYSYWAAFMSNSIVIHHPETWVENCRDKQTNKNIFEGAVKIEEKIPELLISNIRSI